MGFFGMLIVGVIAGYIAERVMNRDHGLLTNMLVGIAGSFLAGTLAGLIGISYYGWIANIVVATFGAIGILWFFGKRENPRMHRLVENERQTQDANLQNHEYQKDKQE